MKVTVLGSGSKGNCYILEAVGAMPLLLEAGLPIKKIREGLNFGLSRVAGCLITHEHGDHSRGVRDLIHLGIGIYATGGTLDALGLEGHNIHRVMLRKPFKTGSWGVLALPIEHDAEEPCCFLVSCGGERLLYMTDTAYSPYTFKGLTKIMIEANYCPDILKTNVKRGIVDKAVQKRVLKNHMSIERAKEFLRKTDLSKVTEIILVHLSDDNSDAERFKREVQGVTGKVVKIA